MLLNEEDQNPARSYQELILQESLPEKDLREAVDNDESLSPERKQREHEKLEERFYYRRVINSQYFKQIKALVESRNFL